MSRLRTIWLRSIPFILLLGIALLTACRGGAEEEVEELEPPRVLPGTAWFIAGTDSGFEGLTALYYDTITVVLEQE